jgi:hypothetical protein
MMIYDSSSVSTGGGGGRESSGGCIYHPFLIGFLKLSGEWLLLISGFRMVCLSLRMLESSLAVSNEPVELKGKEVKDQVIGWNEFMPL